MSPRHNFDSVAHAEADAYVAFENLMEELKDRFMVHRRQSSDAVPGFVREFLFLLHSADADLCEHLVGAGGLMRSS